MSAKTMPPVGAPTPPELVGLPHGTGLEVFVDGRVREATIISVEDQFDGEPKWGPDAPPNVLVPGYWVGLGGSFAGVKARNIVKVVHRPQRQTP